MSYQSVVVMAASQSLQARLIAAAAAAGVDGSPQMWVQNHLWKIISNDTNWGDEWDRAIKRYDINANPDTGMRSDVITDQMIATEVEAVLAETSVPVTEEPDPDPGPLLSSSKNAPKKP